MKKSIIIVIVMLMLCTDSHAESSDSNVKQESSIIDDHMNHSTLRRSVHIRIFIRQRIWLITTGIFFVLSRNPVRLPGWIPLVFLTLPAS